jgi:hypothetical protein
MDKELLTRLIVAFLALNSKPSDAQVHGLAESVNTDHETLEAIMYEMLADSKETVVATGDTGLSEQQEVLDGDYDPNTTSPDDLILNDGAPEGTSNQQQTQDSTLDDGVGADDVGVDVSGDQEALIDDGASPNTLRAALRLGLVTANTYTDCDKWESDLMKKYPKADVAPDRNDPNDRNLIAYEDESHDSQVGYWKFTGSRNSSTGEGKGEITGPISNKWM